MSAALSAPEEEWPPQRLAEVLGRTAGGARITPQQAAFCDDLRGRFAKAQAEGASFPLTARECEIIARIDAQIRKTDSIWPAATIDKAAGLWQLGLSASNIGARLGGFSKNAVVGKIHRLIEAGDARFASRPSPIIRDGRPKAPHIRRKPKMTLAPLPSIQDPAPAPASAAPMARTPRPLARPFNPHPECQFPIGDPGSKGFRFCDAPTDLPGPGERAKPYCREHCALVYTKPQLSERQQKALAARALARDYRQGTYANAD